ncbi:MAG TPA: hypothetical protein VIE42_13805 [Steroidobacteraceae bacterium]
MIGIAGVGAEVARIMNLRIDPDLLWFVPVSVGLAVCAFLFSEQCYKRTPITPRVKRISAGILSVCLGVALAGLPIIASHLGLTRIVLPGDLESTSEAFRTATDYSKLGIAAIAEEPAIRGILQLGLQVASDRMPAISREPSA